MEVGTHTNRGGVVKAGLPATATGKCRVDCDERQGAGGGPMTEVVGDGDLHRGGIIDGKSGAAGKEELTKRE